MPVVDLSKKATAKSIPERRDEYHITIATLLGCELGAPFGYRMWRYRTLGDKSIWGWSSSYNTAADAARAWLIENNHDLDGWCNEKEARTHGEESNPAGN